MDMTAPIAVRCALPDLQVIAASRIMHCSNLKHLQVWCTPRDDFGALEHNFTVAAYLPSRFQVHLLCWLLKPEAALGQAPARLVA